MGTIVAVVQTIARPGDITRSVEDHVRLAGRAADRGARLALFPELSLTGYDRRLTRADAIGPEEIAFVPGMGGEPLSIDGQTVCLAICADTTHPEHARDAALRGADICAASSFITPDGYAHDAGMLAGYAEEHEMAVVMANYGSKTGDWDAAGRSAIWSKAGKLLAQAAPQGEEVVIAEV